MSARNSFRCAQPMILVMAMAAWLASYGAAVTQAQGPNLVQNGDFSANAASFVTWPGYVGGGSNPNSINNWTTSGGNGGGTGVNGTLAPGGSPFAPANNVPSFLLMQGDQTASQAIGTAAGYVYGFNFSAAARNGNTSGLTVYADNTTAANLTIADGSLNQNNFVNYAFAFTATGAQTIQFNSSGLGDHTSDVTNVSVCDISGVWQGNASGTLGSSDLNFAAGNLSFGGATALTNTLYFGDSDGIGGFDRQYLADGRHGRRLGRHAQFQRLDGLYGHQP